jgi:hypothetical protein
MKWDVLLHWMTHLGEGSWSSFRAAVAKLADTEADVDEICPRLRVVFSDLGHADFFVDDSQRWRVLPPVLAGLPPPAQTAVLTGGCTPHLAATVLEAAAVHGCRAATANGDGQPGLLRLEGSKEALKAAAAAAGISYVENYAASVSASIKPVALQLHSARVEEPPSNWTVHSFDFGSLGWVEGLRRRSPCEFRPRYGRSKFYFHANCAEGPACKAPRSEKGGHLLRLDRCEGGKRDVVYAAAMIREVRLAVYDAAAETLSVPTAAPLPELYARVACLCAGAPATFDEGRLIYRNVPHAIAAVLLVAAGQPYPGPPHGQPV